MDWLSDSTKRKIYEDLNPRREIPVLRETDVLVVGGGMAGVVAALGHRAWRVWRSRGTMGDRQSHRKYAYGDQDCYACSFDHHKTLSENSKYSETKATVIVN
ncbi:MAG TPA: hypothetical protein PKO23_11700 [Candidatus Hydrogenedentes bacterium]|nr:hypothetical protein [Candidatus Hydrogenedentota bacterium]